jgi:hypothetical protein
MQAAIVTFNGFGTTFNSGTTAFQIGGTFSWLWYYFSATYANNEADNGFGGKDGCHSVWIVSELQQPLLQRGRPKILRQVRNSGYHQLPKMQHTPGTFQGTPGGLLRNLWDRLAQCGIPEPKRQRLTLP